MEEVQGFIVAAWEEGRQARSAGPRGAGAAGRIFLTGRLDDRRSFAAVVPAPRPALYLPWEHGPAALACLGGASLDPEPWSDLPGAALARLEVGHAALDGAELALAAAHLPVLVRERPRAAEALLALGLHGPVAIRGRAAPGRRVDAVFVEPTLGPCRASTPLAWLALDIETDRAGTVVAVSLAGAGGAGEVLFVGPPLGVPEVASFPTEAALLSALARRLLARDPDVITGWNVIDFDLRVLAKRYAAHGLPFDVGRTAEEASLLDREGRRAAFQVSGRAVLDAMRLVRASGERFDDLSLEAVARAVLGEGKTVSARGLAKLDELDRLRREEPITFCAYCLRDSELVLRILARTGLDALTARRAALTGVSLELAWTSIPAFERIYAAELRSRRVLPPPRAERRVSGAAGGTVLEALPGFFPNVLVFDFRSLYPSLIRTFNIDPLAHARADQRAPAPDDLVAPNGARFERAAGILPAIITRYAEEREAALAAGDETAAYVYKILQNSFYGVLGADGCRYARTELAGAITSFGKVFLTAARDFFEQRGLRTLYGDTDSVFVLSGLGDEAGFDDLAAFGARAADELNAALTGRIRREHDVPSHLRIRCEKAYRRFFIPRLKHDHTGEGRGRAKGYAGLRLGPGGAAEVEVKGMEAARSDFTPLARRFQVELLARAFADAGEAEVAGFCRDLVTRLQGGSLDAELVYRRSLRRPAEDYGTESPQVRAARLLGWKGQRGRISYVMTRAGAEPVEARSGARLDYQHYLERQLLPIARSVAEARGWDARPWFGGTAQLGLFGS
ncbi:MAG: DNA polymerase II [Anaeromyxobacter sp.]|nr:DNA polymerase II [Anaeromyxobacter sp.]MBL0276891.1 DNA polymerase II [Anaeromyxobacter sp.]